MNPLQSRLSALRRRLWMVVTFRGLCWLLTLFLGTVAVAGLLDWRVHLPGLVRAVVLVGLLGGGGYVFYRFLIRPLWARTDDLSLALQVEAAYPALNDSLASTVQFLEQPESSDLSGSPALRRLAVNKTMQQIDQCDFKQVVDTRGMGAAGLSLLGIGVVAVVLVLLHPSLAWTAFLRLADPFGGNDWPRQTRLELDPIRNRIGRGEFLDVGGRVFGVVPEQATVDLEGLTPSRLPVAIVRAADGSGAFQVKLDRAERSFRFQVRANDAVSEWCLVAVLPPPVLVPLDGRPSPQVHLRFPTYTDLPDVDLPDGSGNIEAVLGTRVTFRAATDRPVVKAWIEYRPADGTVIPAALLNGFAATTAFG